MERKRHAFAAELLFAEFHQFECFFAMLIAAFQDLPHWIFMSSYPPGEIKRKAQLFVNEEFLESSNGQANDRETFLRHAIFGIYFLQRTEEEWQKTFDNLWWVICRMARKYIDVGEYNSYKHGLRVISSSFTLALSSNPSDFLTHSSLDRRTLSRT